LTQRFHTTFLYGAKKCLTKSASHVAANSILTRKRLNRSFVLPKHVNASGGGDRNNGGGRRILTTGRMTRGITRSGQQRIAVTGNSTGTTIPLTSSTTENSRKTGTSGCGSPELQMWMRSLPLSGLPSGRYMLTPYHKGVIAKVDAWIVEITVLSAPYEDLDG
jgi:hypothetical protein